MITTTKRTPRRSDRKKSQIKTKTYDENEIHYIPIAIFEKDHDDKTYADSNKVNTIIKTYRRGRRPFI